MTNEKITSKIASSLTGKSSKTCITILKLLVDKDILKWHGNSNRDPTQYYSLNSKYK